MRLAAVAIIVTLVTAGYFWWKHDIAQSAIEERDQEWQDRDRIDIDHAKLLQHQREGEINELKQQYEHHNETELTRYREYVKTLTAANAASNDRVNKLQRHAERKVSCAAGGETKANDSGGIGGTGAEAIQIDKSLKALEIVMEEYVLRYFEVVK